MDEFGHRFTSRLQHLLGYDRRSNTKLGAEHGKRDVGGGGVHVAVVARVRHPQDHRGAGVGDGYRSGVTQPQYGVVGRIAGPGGHELQCCAVDEWCGYKARIRIPGDVGTPGTNSAHMAFASSTRAQPQHGPTRHAHHPYIYRPHCRGMTCHLHI